MAISTAKKIAAAATLTVLTCSQGLLMEGSKEGHKYPYNVATVPLMSEFMKLILSGILLYQQYQKDPKGTQMTVDWKSVMLFPIPSIIYLFHNNVQFYTMAYVDAATYQILGNLKIVTTGFLFWVALKRYLSRIQRRWRKVCLTKRRGATNMTQWLALLLLMAGATGYMLGILSAFLSATAGVYTEFLMKKNNDSLYFQNVQLYGFGTLFNAIRLSYDDYANAYEKGSWLTSGLHGWNWVTWSIAINFAFSGLFVSWIMKYADTIVKVYATSSAMLLTAVLSVWFFGLEPTLQMFLGIIIACISINLYFMPKDSTPPGVPPPSAKVEEPVKVDRTR